MSESIMSLHYDVCADDFKAAGEASSDVKNKLKVMGFPPDIVRRVAIAMYEGEINMVIHANGGEITVDITMDEIIIVLKDVARVSRISTKPWRQAIPQPPTISVRWALAQVWDFRI